MPLAIANKTVIIELTLNLNEGEAEALRAFVQNGPKSPNVHLDVVRKAIFDALTAQGIKS